MIEITTDTAVPRKRRNEKETKVPRKKRKEEKKKEEQLSDQEEQEEEIVRQMENQTIQIPSPEYVPPEFSSEEEESENEETVPIQSHANIECFSYSDDFWQRH